MTVASMSYKELSRFNTLQLIKRGKMGPGDAEMLLGVSRRAIGPVRDHYHEFGQTAVGIRVTG